MVKIPVFSPGDRWQLVSIRAKPFFKFTDGKGFVAVADYKGQFLPQAVVLPSVDQVAHMRNATGNGDGDAFYLS